MARMAHVTAKSTLAGRSAKDAKGPFGNDGFAFFLVIARSAPAARRPALDEKTSGTGVPAGGKDSAAPRRTPAGTPVPLTLFLLAQAKQSSNIRRLLDCFAQRLARKGRHCEERSDAAIQSARLSWTASLRSQ